MEASDINWLCPCWLIMRAIWRWVTCAISVRNNAGDFGLALGGQQQPGMNADESPGQGKRIDLTVANNKKLEFLPCRIAARRQPCAETVGNIPRLRHRPDRPDHGESRA